MKKIENFSDTLILNVERNGDVKCIADYKKSFSYTEFYHRVNQFSNKLSALGVERGEKVLIPMQSELDFYVVSYAVMRIGAVACFIDSKMSKEHLFECIEKLAPKVFIGHPNTYFLKRIFGKKFPSIERYITMSKISGPTGSSIYQGLKKQSESFTSVKPSVDEIAVILYSSGSTGKPKAIEFDHASFLSQGKTLQSEYGTIKADDTIMSFTALFPLFSIGFGLCTYIGDNNQKEFDGKLICKTIVDQKITFLAGSPLIGEEIANYCLENSIKLDSVQTFTLFGAMTSIGLHQKIQNIMPNGTSTSCYGAGECLSVSSITGKFILSNIYQLFLAGHGTCVGKPMSGVRIKIIRESEKHIANFKDCEFLRTDEIGEILVEGGNLALRYHHDEGNIADVKDGNKHWHRMGDVGFIDSHGLLWFCGRKTDIVEISNQKFYPDQIESIYNQHPKIKRSALVKHKNKLSVVIERHDGKSSIEPMFLVDLKNLSQTHEQTKNVQQFFAHPEFPVDYRHKMKIDRKMIEANISDTY